jgi:hypothetical protein
MADEPGPALPYATSTTRPVRFRVMSAVLPLGGGMLVGLVLSGCILAAGPDLSRPAPVFGWWPLAVPLGVGLAWLYAVAALFLIGCFSPRPLAAGPWMVAGTLGFLLPVCLTAAGLLVRVLCALAASTQSLEDAGLAAVALLSALVALAIPFLLVQWRQAVPAPLHAKRRARVAAAVVFGPSVVGLALVPAWHWSERRALDRDCGRLAAWVKASFPAPGSHSRLALPAQFRALAADGAADATVMPDGRVVLLLKTSLGWHGNWSGVVFFTGPIRPAEVGRDAYGRPQVMVPGLSYHFVKKGVDDRHFVVAFDLG